MVREVMVRFWRGGIRKINLTGVNENEITWFQTASASIIPSILRYPLPVQYEPTTQVWKKFMSSALNTTETRSSSYLEVHLRLQPFICLLAEGQVIRLSKGYNHLYMFNKLYIHSWSMLSITFWLRCHRVSVAIPSAALSQTARFVSKPLSVMPSW